MKIFSPSSLLQFFLFAIGLSFSGTTTLAQIVPDNTLNTQVDSNGNFTEITGGQTRSGNLFHSFQDFSVRTGNVSINAASVEFVLEDWRVEEGSLGATGRSPEDEPRRNATRVESIIEAERWIVNQQGKVVLIAAEPASAANDLGREPMDCQTN